MVLVNHVSVNWNFLIQSWACCDIGNEALSKDWIFGYVWADQACCVPQGW